MVWVISEIQSAIQWVITEFLAKLPRPLQFLIFLFFVLILGFLISLFLHLVGVHCTSDNVPVRMSITDIGGNYNILTAKKDVLQGDNLSICDVHPEKCGGNIITSATKLGWDCFYFARPLPDGNYEGCNDTLYSSDCRYFYREGNCFNCTVGNICLDPDGCTSLLGVSFDRQRVNVCLSDARALPTLSLSCRLNGVGSCSIPYGYVWNFTTGAFDCEDTDLCGFNSTEAYAQVDQLLKEADAKNIYEDEEEYSYTRLISITCDDDLDPQLAFFGIPLFDYRIWVLLMVLTVMFWFLTVVKRN